MIELAIVILLAAGLGIAARFLRQPIVLAYLATGALIGYVGLFDVGDRETFQIFSDLGIMFLLFLIGLEIDYRSLAFVGKVSLLIGLGQVIFTFVIGLGLTMLFGFAWLPAIYIAMALTLSSTIIVVKALSERKALTSLYGKISLGVLLAQDAVAIVVLLVLRGFEAGEGVSVGSVLSITVAGVLLFWDIGARGDNKPRLIEMCQLGNIGIGNIAKNCCNIMLAQNAHNIGVKINDKQIFFRQVMHNASSSAMRPNDNNGTGFF